MKILVAVPCLDMIQTQFVDCLFESMRFNEEYDIQFGASSLVYDTRNQFIDKAIDREYDRILWIDSDMKFDSQTLAYLNQDLDAGYDFVSTLCFKRRPPYSPVVFKTCDMDKTDHGVIIPRSKVYEDYPEDCLFECAAFGFGMVMMSVKGLKRIVERYGRLLFCPLTGFGEDLSFCLRAKSAGERLFCDSRAEVGHVGQYTFDSKMFKKR